MCCVHGQPCIALLTACCAVVQASASTLWHGRTDAPYPHSAVRSKQAHRRTCAGHPCHCLFVVKVERVSTLCLTAHSVMGAWLATEGWQGVTFFAFHVRGHNVNIHVCHAVCMADVQLHTLWPTDRCIPSMFLVSHVLYA